MWHTFNNYANVALSLFKLANTWGVLITYGLINYPYIFTVPHFRKLVFVHLSLKLLPI